MIFCTLFISVSSTHPSSILQATKILGGGTKKDQPSFIKYISEEHKKKFWRNLFGVNVICVFWPFYIRMYRGKSKKVGFLPLNARVMHLFWKKTYSVVDIEPKEWKKLKNILLTFWPPRKWGPNGQFLTIWGQFQH